MEEAEADFTAGMGGPGAEDFANGAAALAAGLVREARALAETAAALRAAVAVVPGDPSGGPLADVRRQRTALHAAGEAALRAALLLEAAEVLGGGGDSAAQAGRIIAAARRAGLPPAGLAAPVLAASLSLDTDDGAARIAATILAQRLAGLLRG
ncbi:hypothetical protein [Siccirubricoccus sp. G192]|uniref:hypothetical protein n=1 Tax=Siccirubricoccus sp. G192 TaxID=2849651 RepID=UPI001C2CBAE1|nr:hypothetical protein [Siccirubricoccus sp. G192]MBV1797658.1 hypothetical protein [Siccirubricoccus sp. G192]